MYYIENKISTNIHIHCDHHFGKFACLSYLMASGLDQISEKTFRIVMF